MISRSCLILLLLSLHAWPQPVMADTRLSMTQEPAVQQRRQRPKPARGSYDLAFDFYDGPDPETATLIGSENQFAVPLRQGRFAITLPIPASLRRKPQIWLNVQAAPGGTDHYVNLSPRNLPVKTSRQNRVSSRLRISGTILDKKGHLLLGPYETVWLFPASHHQPVQVTRQAPKTQPPPPPATVLERIQRDLGLQAGQFHATARLEHLWPFRDFPLYGGDQLLNLLQPENGKAVERLPENLLFLLEIPDTDAVLLETLLHREPGFILQLDWTGNNENDHWLRIELEVAQLLEVHRLDPNLYSLRIHAEYFNLQYRSASTRALADNKGAGLP